MSSFHLNRPVGPVWDWLVQWLFTERLGLEYRETVFDTREIRLEREGRALAFPARAGELMENWAARAGQGALHATQRLTAQECVLWPEGAAPLPVLADGPARVKIADDAVDLSFDPLALAALLLSGAEEILDPARDAHERYTGGQSISAREGWLDRPVLDETVALLRGFVNHLWPNEASAPRRGRMQVSCDVDQPFSPDLRQTYTYLRAVGGDLISRRDPWLAFRRTVGGLLTPLGLSRFDLSDTFVRFMDVLERSGQRGQFFIISGHSAGLIDGSYHLHQPRIRALLSRLARRGHVLGMHGSYNTFRDPVQIKRERDTLMDTLTQIGVNGPGHGEGNRQHFLRWDMGQTPDHLQAAGFGFDTSGSYPDMAGFRFGTAQDFAMWSWQTCRALMLRQQPLIAMECSVIAPRYMGLGYGPAAYATFERLQDRAMAHGGTFTLLWHNSHFMHDADWRLFEHLVARGAQIAGGAVTP